MGFLRKIFSPNTKANSATWADIGEIQESFEIRYFHPDHATYPHWPGGDRNLGLVKANWGTQIVYTQGLSSAGSDSIYELYLETPEKIDAFSSSWQANVVYELGRFIPRVPDLKDRISKYTYLSVQIQIDGAPEEWSINDPNGNIGLFIGNKNPLIDQQKFGFTPLNLKLMRPNEMKHAIENGAAGRELLASLYAKQGGATLSFLDRASVLT